MASFCERFRNTTQSERQDSHGLQGVSLWCPMYPRPFFILPHPFLRSAFVLQSHLGRMSGTVLGFIATTHVQ